MNKIPPESKEWRMIRFVNYLLMPKGEDGILSKTAMLISKDGYLKYIDCSLWIDALMHETEAGAKKCFEEFVERRMGKICWDTDMYESLQFKTRNINRLIPQKSDNAYIAKDGAKWRKVHTRSYVIMFKNMTLLSTATLVSKDGWVQYVDEDREIESTMQRSEDEAKTCFEEIMKLRIGQIYWARDCYPC